MQHEERATETKPVERIVRRWTTCDFCQAEIREDAYEVREGVLSLRLGDAYPDSGHTTEQRVDICESCWEAKLLPWLASLGIVPQTHRVDW